MIKIQVPATTANIGSGFDSLGIALKMYNNVYIEEYDGIDISSNDNVFIPMDSKNLVFASAKRVYELCGKDFKGLKIKQENVIPMARGMGSSSACIVAGLVGANKILGNPLSKDELLNIAVKLEGHPDNVVAATLGGLTVSAIKDKKVYGVSIPISSRLCFALLIPPFELKTSRARNVLKQYYSREDAVFNISRSALTIASLFSAKFENLKVSVEDRIHQPYRLGLIDGAKDIFNIAYELGSYGTYISGAGPTIASIIDKKNAGNFKENILKEMENKNIRNWKLEVLDVDYNGARIIY